MTTNLEHMSFAELLAEMERRLRAAETHVPDRLAPGLPAEVVRSRLADVGLEAPDDLVTWFGWHNGIHPDLPVIGIDQLIVEIPFSLDRCLDDWHRQDHGVEPWQWERGWLPIAYHDNADRLAIDCTPAQGEVAQAFMAAPDKPFPHRSPGDVHPLATVVRWWMEAWETGAHEYYTDPFPGFGPTLMGEARQAAIPPERRSFL